MSDEKTKHQIFLETFVETRDISEAARRAGIENPATIKNYYSHYKNYYKALFEKIGMPEDSLLEVLGDLSANAEKDSDKLKAIELILKLTGALTDATQTVNVNVGADKEKEKQNEIAIYGKIKNDPVLCTRLLEVMEAPKSDPAKN